MSRFSDSAFLKQEHSLGEVMAHEQKMFREFQQLSYPEYRKERIAYLKGFENAGSHLAWLEACAPKIAVFAGSFNPFHRGHLNVLEKAERIFDKVIVAFGRNPEKDSREWPVPQSIKNRQIESYHGLLTDFISGLGHDAVVIRGLRNSTDFQYEQNQYRYIQELMPGIRIVNIFCDKEFEHISSSGIRTLEQFGKHKKYLLD